MIIGENEAEGGGDNVPLAAVHVPGAPAATRNVISPGALYGSKISIPDRVWENWGRGGRVACVSRGDVLVDIVVSLSINT